MPPKVVTYALDDSTKVRFGWIHPLVSRTLGLTR